jgi:hypothetical protein
MSLALITTAIAAGHELETDDAALAAAKVADDAAKVALTSAAQSLHDDLVANGPEVLIDSTKTPPTVTLYQSVDPGSYSATAVRVAS